MASRRELDEAVAALPLDHAGRLHPVAERVVRRVLIPLARLCHRPTMQGVEQLPASGPYLLVGNHSAGLGLAELSSFTALWTARGEPVPPLAGFAHPTAFVVWPTSVIHPSLGAIPSTYAAAETVLARGIPLLVFPGGDHETMRGLLSASRVDFGGRLGFLRIARKAAIPIVPLGIRGGRFTAPLLFSHPLLPTLLLQPRFLLGTKRWAVSLLGVLGLLALATTGLPLVAKLLLGFLWLGSPLVFLSWVPVTLRFRIGAPLPPEALFDGPEDDAVLREALAKVEAAVQAQVDAP